MRLNSLTMSRDMWKVESDDAGQCWITCVYKHYLMCFASDINGSVWLLRPQGEYNINKSHCPCNIHHIRRTGARGNRYKQKAKIKHHKNKQEKSTGTPNKKE